MNVIPFFILIVDDEINVGKTINRALFQKYSTHITDSPKQALYFLENHHSNTFLVISDFKMPEMDGITFLQIIKQRYPNIVRVLLSAFTDQLSVINVVNDLEIFRVIEKPFDLNKISNIADKAYKNYQITLYLNSIKSNEYNQETYVEFKESEYNYDEYLKIFSDTVWNEQLVQTMISTINKICSNKKYSSYKKELIYTAVFYNGIPENFIHQQQNQTVKVDLEYIKHMISILSSNNLPTHLSEDFYYKIKDIKKYQTEYFNGKGKMQLKSFQIPIESSIFAVVATYSYYSNNKTTDLAEKILKWGVSYKFDPLIVSSLFKN